MRSSELVVILLPTVYCESTEAIHTILTVLLPDDTKEGYLITLCKEGLW